MPRESVPKAVSIQCVCGEDKLECRESHARNAFQSQGAYFFLDCVSACIVGATRSPHFSERSGFRDKNHLLSLGTLRSEGTAGGILVVSDPHFWAACTSALLVYILVCTDCSCALASTLCSVPFNSHPGLPRGRGA